MAYGVGVVIIKNDTVEHKPFDNCFMNLAQGYLPNPAAARGRRMGGLARLLVNQPDVDQGLQQPLEGDDKHF